MLESLQELVVKAQKEIGDVTDSQAALAALNGEMVTAKDQLAELQTKLDGATAEVAKQTKEAITVLQEMIASINEEIAKLQKS